MAPLIDNLSAENPLLRTYAFYVALLGLKMLVMSVLTSFNRIKTGTAASPEDLVLDKKAKMTPNENVERVRRAHRNDLENIPVFVFVSLLYILTGPNFIIASMLFRFFTAARIVHTVAYVFLADHKLRGPAWGVGFLITIFMTVNIILSFTANI